MLLISLIGPTLSPPRPFQRLETMTRAPLDGRPRQLERPPLRAHHQSRNKTNTSYMDHLRPASPPKTNPWVKRPSAASLAPEWPVCTPDFSQENEVPAQEKATSRSVKFICSADTKDSDAVSPSKKLLQAAAPRACTRFAWGWIAANHGIRLLTKALIGCGYGHLAPTSSSGLAARFLKCTVASWSRSRHG